MTNAIVVGLTAPFQHGKTELRPVIEQEGWKFVDVNDFQNSLRLPGTERRARYERLIPGCLDDEGGETLIYYRNIANVPTVRAELLPEELPLVAEMVRHRIQKAQPGEKIVLSWELWHRILSMVHPQHMLIFHQPHERWFDRVHRRIGERGWGDWTPDDAELVRVIEAMDADPRKNEPLIIKRMSEFSKKPCSDVTVLDVSPEDWAAPTLLSLLRMFSNTLA